MKLYMETYGCTAIQGEGEFIRRRALEANHRFTPNLEEADACVINTCVVLDTTERKMIRRLQVLGSSGLPVIVSGCMPPAMDRRVRSHVPEAHLIKPRNLEAIDDILSEIGPPSPDTPLAPDDSFGAMNGVGGYRPQLNQAYQLQHVINIAQGCRSYCSFCITKRARGDLRTSTIPSLLQDMRQAYDAGSREFRLTGQDTGVWGFDLGTNLSELLRAIGDLPFTDHVMARVGMMNPGGALQFIDDLLDAYDQAWVYKFVHLPLQSGSDRILSSMRRDYTVEEYMQVARAFRERFPDLTLSTDVIVGFPGETPEDHRLTLEVLQELAPEALNVTRFSARSGTGAAKMPDQVPGPIMKDRSREVTALRHHYTAIRNERHLDSELDVLVLKEGRDGTWICRTRNYDLVILSEPVTPGRFYRASITENEGMFLRATVVGGKALRVLS